MEFASGSPQTIEKLAKLLARAETRSTPPLRTTPDEWSRRSRSHGPTSGRPGPRRPEFTPYIVDFERAFDLTAQREAYGAQFDAIALACGSQMAKTEAVLDVIGWTAEQRPGPIMYVGPTEHWLNTEFEPRLMEMLRTTPALSRRLATGKRITKYRKPVNGVPIVLAWAGSASNLRGTAAKVALLDELDAMGTDVDGNGDPFALLESRGFSFRDRIRAAISTPLTGTVDTYKDDASGLEFWKKMEPEDISSPIWRLWQSGTMHHWAWPCPCCGEYFVPRFKHLQIAENATPAQAKRDAFILCPHPSCGGVITEQHKTNLNARGRYVAPGQSVSRDGVVSGPLPEVTTLSFWVSGLCSPFVTIGERAASYVKARISGQKGEVQSVMNTGFGELFAPGGGDVPEWQHVQSLKAGHAKGVVPDWVKLLTAGVDVQGNRLVYVVRGWGAQATSALIDHGELWGKTTEENVWNDLALLLTGGFGDIPIHKMIVDSGYRPGKPFLVPQNRVYEFCRRFPRQVHPSKGKDTAPKPIHKSNIEVRPDGNAKPYGLELLWLDTDHWKSWLLERIRWPMTQPGAWFLHAGADEDYCKQIVSEARVKSPSGKAVWVQRSRNNHFLDAECLAAAAGHMLNVHLLRGSLPEMSLTAVERVSRPASTPSRPPAPRAQAPAAEQPPFSPAVVPAALPPRPAHPPRPRRSGAEIARMYR